MYKRIGKYEIIEELGHGGQGTVFKAVDTTLGNRPVVIKLIEMPGGKPKTEMGAQALERFKREAEITAQLNNPQIAQVFDYGIDQENEVAWLARQYLDGRQLSEIIKEDGAFDFESGKEIVIGIAKVLEYLHGKNIVHRDIKPSNVFIQNGIPVLIDFGLAFQAGEQTELTKTEQAMGTEGYLPPELVNRSTRDKYQKTPHRDWWGLGCLAFEMFTGRKLYDYDESSLIIAAVVQAEEQDDVESALKSEPAYQIVKGLLERDPEKRVSRVSELKKLSKSILKTKRKPPPAVEIVDEKESEFNELRNKREKIEEELRIIDEERKRKHKIEEEERKLKESEERLLLAQTITLSGHTGIVYSVAFSPDGTKLASGSDDETIKIWSVSDGKEIRTLEGHSNSVNSVAFSPDGTKLASGSDDETIKIWSVSDGSEICTLRGHSRSVKSVAFSPDGTKLASGSKDETIKIWSVVNGKEIRTLSGNSGCVISVAFSPDGAKLASGNTDNTIKIWSVVNGKEIRTLHGHSKYVTSVAFSPDGTKLASGSDDETIKIWSVSDGKEIRTLEGHSNSVESVSFSPNGTKLASGSMDGTIKIWSVSDGKEIRTLHEDYDDVISVAFSPDGTKLASAILDETIKIWRIE